MILLIYLRFLALSFLLYLKMFILIFIVRTNSNAFATFIYIFNVLDDRIFNTLKLKIACVLTHVITIAVLAFGSFIKRRIWFRTFSS